MTEWHLDETLLTQWIAGEAEAVYAASTEQHVVRCAACRDRVRDITANDRPRAVPDLDAVWAAVRDEIEVPATGVAERLLARLGLSPSDAQLVAAAPAFRGAWLGALCVVLVFATLAAAWADTRGATLFLLVAPLLPVVGVALSYGAEADPALEQEAATPYSPLRLVLLRTLAVLGGSVPLLAVSTVLVPGRTSYLWLLPALGFTAVVLAVSTWTDPLRPAAVVAVGWLVAVGWSAQHGGPGLVLGDACLAAYAALLAAGLVVLLVRTRRVATLGGNW